MGKPPLADNSQAGDLQATSDESGSALLGYVGHPTEPRMRAVSGRHPVAAELFHPTEPPQEQLGESHSRVKIQPLEPSHGDAPDGRISDPLTERRTPVTDRCASQEEIGQAAGRDRMVLVRLDGAEAGQIVSVSSRALTVGRDASAGVHLADVGVSRNHARLVHRDCKLWVEDLVSRNGTYVNGMRVVSRELCEGDLVQFGPRATFRFSLMDVRQEQALQRLYESSIHDALTGAYNRRYLEERLRMEIAFAVRHRADCALVILDIDHFKQVNDRYGHAAGDLALKHLVSTCAGTLRLEDMIARYGGEEFVILLRDVGIEGAVRAAERVRQNVKRTLIDVGVTSLQVTLSAGCAALTECARPSSDALIFLADQRLYIAKRQGRDRVVAHDGRA